MSRYVHPGNLPVLKILWTNHPSADQITLGGSTAVIYLLVDSQIFCGNLGDSGMVKDDDRFPTLLI